MHCLSPSQPTSLLSLSVLCSLDVVSFLVENQKRRNIFFHGSDLDSEVLINVGSFGSNVRRAALGGAANRPHVGDQLSPRAND